MRAAAVPIAPISALIHAAVDAAGLPAPLTCRARAVCHRHHRAAPTLNARLTATHCTDCVAILKKCRSSDTRPDFYLATAYPLPPRAKADVMV